MARRPCLSETPLQTLIQKWDLPKRFDVLSEDTTEDRNANHDKYTGAPFDQYTEQYTEALLAMPQEACPVSIMQAKAKRQAKTTRGGNKCKKELDKKWRTENNDARTMMICDIPFRLEQEEVVFAIDSMGFVGLHDLVSLPAPQLPKGPPQGKGNLGYAFVRFFDPEVAAQFKEAFEGYQFQGTCSTKKCRVQLVVPRNSKVPAKGNTP